MFDRILIPTDGSSYANAAAETGLDLAEVHDATVHILSVADVGPLRDIQLPGETETPETALRGVAEESVAALTELAEQRGIEVTGAVRIGPTAAEIEAYAEEIEADCIVMGTRGRGGVKRLAMGSVTDHVVQSSDIPVLVCSSEEDS